MVSRPLAKLIHHSFLGSTEGVKMLCPKLSKTDVSPSSVANLYVLLQRVLKYVFNIRYRCRNCGEFCNGEEDSCAVVWRYVGELDEDDEPCGFGKIEYFAMN